MSEENKSEVVVPTFGEMKALVRIVMWAALIAVGGWISFPVPLFGGVPISLQTFYVILCGLVEGPRNGALAAGLYLLAGFLGLPVFTGGLGGPAIVFRPSAGFALAFPLGALVTGLAFSRRNSRYGFIKSFCACALGSALILTGGFIGLMLNTGMNPTAAAALAFSFFPGDLAKSAAAASLAQTRLFQRQ